MAAESADGPLSAVPWSAELRTLAARFGDGVAVVDGEGRQLRFRELDREAHLLARTLRSAGIGPGSAVASLLPNGVDAVRAAYAIRLIGAAEVPLAWRATPSEIAWCTRLAPVAVVLTQADRAAALREAGLPVRVVREALQDADEAADAGAGSDELANASGADEALPAVPAEAIGRILFTSGTTGRPKGVVYDHGRRWLGEQMLKATLPFVPAPGERIILMTPFPHGASLLAFAWLAHGGQVVLLDGVDPPQIDALLAQRAAALFAPPTVLAKLAAALGDRRFEGVRCVFTGTQPLAANLYARANAMFGPVLRITYGKTECVNPITVLDPRETEAWFAQPQRPAGACVGYPAPGVEIEIRDAVDAGEGEVWLRARHMSNGLRDENGDRPHEAGGWHRSGDLGYIDACGRLVLTGRVADVIKTGGYRVNPDEVESLLAGMGGGAVCVTSLASDYWGEIIVAVAEQPGVGWRDEVEARVAPLSRHKRPRLHVELPILPRNAQGKVNRRQVAQTVLEAWDLIDGPYPALRPRADARAADLPSGSPANDTMETR